VFCVSLTKFHTSTPQVDLRYTKTLGSAVSIARSWAQSQSSAKYMVEVWMGAYNDGNPVYWMTADNH
jgi:hypothetical protein